MTFHFEELEFWDGAGSDSSDGFELFSDSSCLESKNFNLEGLRSQNNGDVEFEQCFFVKLMKSDFLYLI